DTLVFLAKASWKVKNLTGAVQIARSTGLNLEVLGSRDLPWPLSVTKKLWFKGVRYRGMVDDGEKRAVLKNARALLFPVRWHEPFGIAITEALASGCPVFGTPYGSLPELVPQDVGCLSTQASDLAHALLTRTFSPITCRARVLNGLTHLDMARGYERLYEKLLTDGFILPATEAAPKTRFEKPSESLLPWTSL
ncbi:MAG: glycosyltransferase, partial [Bdellovibrionota bacterium]